jgi:hypothetical protein
MRKPVAALHRKTAHAKQPKQTAVASFRSKVLSLLLQTRPNQRFILVITALSMMFMYLAQLALSSERSTINAKMATTELLCDLNDRTFLENGKNVQKCFELIEKNIQSAKEIIRMSTVLREKLSSKNLLESELEDEKANLASFLSTNPKSTQNATFAQRNAQLTANQKNDSKTFGSIFNQWLDRLINQLAQYSAMNEIEAFQNTPQDIKIGNGTEYKPSLDNKQSKDPLESMKTTQQESTLCSRWVKQYQVMPGSNWGKLPKQEQEYWIILNCDCLLASKGCKASADQGLLNTSTPHSITIEGISDAVNRRPEDARLPCRLPKNKEWQAALCVSNAAAAAAGPVRPIVAVLIPTSARGQGWKQAGESHLLATSLPSLLRNTEDGFEYRFYVGYDTDDAFYGREEVQRKITEWFRRELRWGQSAVLLPFANELHKPGPIFNFLSSAAAADGADYLYRINDDTRSMTPFAGAMVGALERMTPPQLGVAGPECRQGNQQILTHDFVHRSHLALFGLHYPSALPDWWMDDWISLVYPPGNTARVTAAVVEHHSAGPRYAVDQRNLRRLGVELAVARAALREHVETRWSAAFVAAHLAAFVDRPDWAGYAADNLKAA